MLEHTEFKNLSPEAQRIYRALVANKEGSTCTSADGAEWASVYLDNAQPAGMSRHQFAGYLSALEAAGLYKPLDGVFGDVRTA